MHKAVVIIPARYHSTRFPGKPLATLNGKPVIQNVFERVSSSRLAESVCIATDDERILEASKGFQCNAIMTSADHESGTDRIAEAAKNMDYDIIVNVQGDEPFIRPEMVDDVITLLREDDRASMSTLSANIRNGDELVSPDVVKVVADNDGYAMYFSRAPIPYHRDQWSGLGKVSFTPGETSVFKHIGIYGFRKNELMRFTSMKRCHLEGVERLEQLRAVVSGMRIKLKVTPYETFGIDSPEDLRKAEKWQSTYS